MNKTAMVRVGLGLVALFSFFLTPSDAQEKIDLPTPPYVAAVPDFFAWTMSIQDADSANQSDPPPATPVSDGVKAPLTILKVVSTKTKKIKHDIIYYNNGNSSEVWYDQNYVIVVSPNGECGIFQSGSPDASFLVPDVSGKGFIGVD